MKPSPFFSRLLVVSAAFATALGAGCSSSSQGQKDNAGESASAAAPDPAPVHAAADARPASAPTPLAPGQKAPDFTAKTQDGSEITLSSLAGKPVVVYFYPKDFTSGCTLEAQNFRDSYADYKTEGATIIGISLDSVDSHQKFAEAHDVPFVLVSDPGGEIAAKYGVSTEGGYARRVTFVIDKAGMIAKTFPGVTVKGHAEEVLAAIRALK